MVVDDWVEDCNLIPMFPTVIKKTRHTEEKAGQGTMKGMTLGSRLGRLERQFRNSCLFELSVRGDWCYLLQEGRGKKRGKKTEARTNEFIQIVEVRVNRMWVFVGEASL